MRDFRIISSRLGVTQFFKNRASLDLELFSKPSETDFLRDYQKLTGRFFVSSWSLYMKRNCRKTDIIF